jgi:hypothetical protein
LELINLEKNLMKMKKYIMAVCLLAAGTFALTSCGEKESIVTLNVNLEKSAASKGYIDNTCTPRLVTGDSAYVNDGVFAFDFENGDPILRVNHASDNVYRAIFPASIVDVNANPDIAHLNNVRVNIPQIQKYEIENGVQKVDMPMISYPEGYRLWFKNMCSIVRVNVINTSSVPIKMDNIQVSNNVTGQSGTGYVYLAGSTHVSVPTATNLPVTTVDPISANRYVQLNIKDADVTIAAGASAVFSLVVAPFSGATEGMFIRVNTDGNGFKDLSLPNVTSLDRNIIADVNFTW